MNVEHKAERLNTPSSEKEIFQPYVGDDCVLRTVAISRRKVLLLCKEWMLVRAKIKTWWMQSHPLFISSLSDSTFVLVLSVHSFIYSFPFPPRHWLALSLPVCYRFLFIFSSFRFPSHSFHFSSAWPLCTHFPSRWKKTAERQRGGKNRRRARKGGGNE